MNPRQPRAIGKSRCRRRSSGYSLIEVLVAVGLVALGLFGALTLQRTSMQFAQSSMNRMKALTLVTELGERMEANPVAALRGEYALATSGTPVTTSADCNTKSCSEAELASFDLAQWTHRVAQENDLPQARWQVTHRQLGTTAEYRMRLEWADRRGTLRSVLFADGATSDLLSVSGQKILRP